MDTICTKDRFSSKRIVTSRDLILLNVNGSRLKASTLFSQTTTLFATISQFLKSPNRSVYVRANIVYAY